ncbi:MAG: hypothetical protein M3268_04620 [Acidobacteriota bacterium]|nr:hypothetical protein [Acidobacteriota bacterium]
MTIRDSKLEIEYGKKSPSRGASNQQVARAGEHFVAAELNKRGAYAVTFAGNMPKIDLLACNSDQSRTVQIQVKTKRSGPSWHSSIVDCTPMEEPANPLDEKKFWVLVDLGGPNSMPRYWIVPDWWMRNDIYTVHQAYLSKHGGRRARNPDSKHHAIEEKGLAAWQDKWDILGIF